MTRGRHPSSAPSDGVDREHFQGIRRTDTAWLPCLLGLRVEGFEADVIGAWRPSSSDDPVATILHAQTVSRSLAAIATGRASFEGPLAEVPRRGQHGEAPGQASFA